MQIRTSTQVFFDNRYELKMRLHYFAKGLSYKPVLITIKTHKLTIWLDRVHQVILNILVTKDTDNKVFDHVYPWVKNLASIEWSIKASYHRTIMDTPGQTVFGIYM